MKLATIRDGSVTRAVRADGDAAADLGAAEVGEVLRRIEGIGECRNTCVRERA